MAFTLYELGLSELILRTFLIFIHSSSAVSRTFSGTARAMPRVRTAARQRRGRCLADTDLMTRSPLSEASIGVVASPSATSIRAPTSGLSRSSGE
jgi:hypothetical protein